MQLLAVTCWKVADASRLAVEGEHCALQDSQQHDRIQPVGVASGNDAALAFDMFISISNGLFVANMAAIAKQPLRLTAI